jgi:capsular exopolysaccharide synthesis family protein
LPRDRTDVIDVDYIAPDPVVAQRVVNTAVQVFQASNERTAKQQSVRRREFIEQQLHKMELLLAEAQAAHNSFRTAHKVYSSREKFQDQQQDLSGIDIRRQELGADRRMYSSMLDAFTGHQGGDLGSRLGALASSPGLGTNLIVAQLYAELGRLQAARDSLTAGTWSRSPDNPDVKRLDAMIRSTEGKILEAVRGQITGIDARIAALDSLRAMVAGQMASLPGTEAQESTLLAQVESYQKQAERLRNELQTAQIDEAAETGQVEIIDLAAFPGFRLGSGKAIKLIFAMLIGLGCGIGAAYIFENHRTVIRRRDELERVFAAPNLALVPRLFRAADGNGSALHATGRILQRFARGENGGGASIAASKASPELVTLSDARSNGAEAYRTLRTNLLFSAAVHRLRRIVITSPGPAEGKSLTAANLSIALAQQGHRVLLIDCDLRRSRIHKMFGEPQGPGLTDVLVGQRAISDAVRVTTVPGLSILPSGTHPPNPAELLGSDSMRTLLDKLSESYDLLVIDTPPLLAASDAAIISTISDGALVVVRAGRTERTALQTAIQQLATVGARVLGTVLNDPDAEVPKYARYYGYYYNNYYEYQNGVT